MSRRRVALGLLCALLGCGKGSDAERRSAADVARAEESVRGADNAHKAQLLSLFASPCVGQEPCDVQRRCRAAYAQHVDALHLTAAAQQRLSDGHGEEAAKLLGSAEQKLQSAGAEIGDCTARAGELRRHYHL